MRSSRDLSKSRIATRRWHSGRLIALLSLALGVTLVDVGAASAVVDRKPAKPTVTLTAPSKGEVGKRLAITAVVKRGVAGQKLTLQRRDGTTWTELASGKVPAKGGTQRKVLFEITPTTSGIQVYRAVLAKKHKTRKAISASLRIEVASASVVEDALTLTVSTKTQNEQTTVTFSGTLTDFPEGTSVTLRLARGTDLGEAAWQDVTTVSATGTGPTLSYAGTVTIPVVRSAATKGAPRINLRAEVAATAAHGGAVSPVKAYLIHTQFEGIYTMYTNGEYTSQNTFVVVYSDRWWRMYFNAVQVTGSTDGWDLLDKGGLRFVATYHEPGLVCEGSTPASEGGDCEGDEDVPWIDYDTTWTEDNGETTYRIHGVATYQPA